jgi:hypothetical protein
LNLLDLLDMRQDTASFPFKKKEIMYNFTNRQIFQSSKLQTFREHHIWNHQAAGNKGKVPIIHTAC